MNAVVCVGCVELGDRRVPGSSDLATNNISRSRGGGKTVKLLFKFLCPDQHSGRNKRYKGKDRSVHPSHGRGKRRGERHGKDQEADGEAQPDAGWYDLCSKLAGQEPECNRRKHTWSRLRSVGNSAKDCIENSIRAKTEISSASLDARTTDAEIAALIDNTEVSLGENHLSS